MTHAFWHERWQNNEIGFHLDHYNPYLTEFCCELDLRPGDTLFIPLCGKTQDMVWLRDQGYQVIGVELSPIACEAFFTEHQIPYSTQQQDNFTVYQSDSITIYCGDFFQTNSHMLSGIRGVFDRGSMVALPQEERERYVEHMRTILPTPISMLMVSFEYAIDEMRGPPYMVTEQELQRHYGDLFQTRLLTRKDVLAENPHFVARGLSQLHEVAYLIHT